MLHECLDDMHVTVMLTYTCYIGDMHVTCMYDINTTMNSYTNLTGYLYIIVE